MNEREANPCELTRADPHFPYNTRRRHSGAASYDEHHRVRGISAMFLLPGPRWSPGTRSPLILLPSESVWVSLSRTMEKNDDRQGRRERTRKRVRKGDEVEEENSERGRGSGEVAMVVVVSSSKNTFIHST